MKSKLEKAARFLRLIDNGSSLSLTNITMYICMLKLAMSVQPSYAEVGSLLLALAAYNVKRVVEKKNTQQSEQDAKVISDLQNKLSGIEDAIKATNDKIGSVALAAGFKNFK